MRRVPRHTGDRLLSLFVPVWRFRCAAPCCGWEDRVRRGAAGRGQARLGSLYSGRQVLEPSRGVCSIP